MVKLLTPSKSNGDARKIVSPTDVSQNPLLPLIEERLGWAIAALGLEVITSRRSHLVFLENAHFRLMLGWYEADTIVCRFEGKSLPGIRTAGRPMQSFDLNLFLYLRLGAGVSEYLPRHGESGNNRHLLCLDAIGAALVNGEMVAPLQGDFSWCEEYFGLEEEMDSIYESLAAMTGYWPEIFGICEKWRMGDPRWIEEARDLLAQVGTRG
jgi:hypothetical protein